jgi:hypothetical protein
MSDRIAWSEGEAAEALGVGERTLRGWRGRRLVPFKLIRGDVLYSPQALQAWLAEPFDDHMEDADGEVTSRTPRAISTSERQLARGGTTRSGKPRAPKPRLPIGLLSGGGSRPPR